jgi:hypothetical protein
VASHRIKNAKCSGAYYASSSGPLFCGGVPKVRRADAAMTRR